MIAAPLIALGIGGYSIAKWEQIDTFEDAGIERPSEFGVAPESTSETTSEEQTEIPVAVEIPEARELETFLLYSVGSNGVTEEQAEELGTRSGGDGLADVVMLVMSNGEEATVLRIPRDTWLDDKLSEIPNLHGAGVMEARIEALTGVEIDHVATGDFWAVAELVDTVGGVDVTIPEDISVNNEIIYEGGRTVHMDGAEAVQFSRMRKIQVGARGGTDFDRIANQGIVIKSLLAKKNTLITNFNEIFSDLEGHIMISDSLNPDTLLSHRNVEIVSTQTMGGLDYGRKGEKSVLVVSDPNIVRYQIEEMLSLLGE